MWRGSRPGGGYAGWLDLVCTQERILNIFRITGLTRRWGMTIAGHCASRLMRNRAV